MSVWSYIGAIDNINSSRLVLTKQANQAQIKKDLSEILYGDETGLKIVKTDSTNSEVYYQIKGNLRDVNFEDCCKMLKQLKSWYLKHKSYIYHVYIEIAVEGWNYYFTFKS